MVWNNESRVRNANPIKMRYGDLVLIATELRLRQMQVIAVPKIVNRVRQIITEPMTDVVSLFQKSVLTNACFWHYRGSYINGLGGGKFIIFY